MKTHRLRLVPLGVLVGLATGCATVSPWERGRLADPAMLAELVPDSTSLEQHFLVTREASAGASGVAGGGCGCN